MSFKLSSNSLKNMEGVNVKLVEIAKKALSISKVDFGIPRFGGVRTEKEQNELFLKKVSNADGYIKKSKHQSGNALDVFAYVDGKASWDMVHMAQIGCAMLQAANELGYKLKWGGLWKSFEDTPHFELTE